METADIFCLLIVAFVCLFFVLDLLGVAWAAFRKKEYESILGQFIGRFADYPSLWWLPVVTAILFIYGLKVCGFFDV